MINKPCGALCLNGSLVKGVCDSCLWYDWDEATQGCFNRSEPICRLYLSDLFPRQPEKQTYC